MWGKPLTEVLPAIYGEQAAVVVVFRWWWPTNWMAVSSVIGGRGPTVEAPGRTPAWMRRLRGPPMSVA